MKGKGRRWQGGKGAGGARWPAGCAAAVVVGLALVAASAVGAAPSGARSDILQTEGEWRDYDSQPLRVNVWQGRGEDEVYRRGEPVEIYFNVNRDAYAVVYRVATDGEVTILWPRSRFDDGFVFGEHEYQLPAAGTPPLRASDVDGVEYVEAIVSLYPFDLRELEVDFHHEANDEPYRYRVAGDPFLALNEVNYAITQVEDSEDYIVTNYVSYYVGRSVEHPRYLCAQCHDADEGYDPYDDTCIIAIHHDYSWSNRWFVRFGYYPLYYYPPYYYIDPWSWRPWINYWYTPWYWWPSYAVYDWPYAPYVWNYSPYWRGDCWQRWREGDRRYVPIDRRRSRPFESRDRFVDRGSQLVKTPRPSPDVESALRTRTKLPRDGDALRGGPAGASLVSAGYRDVRPIQRAKVEFRQDGARAAAAPGLRIRGREAARPAIRPADRGGPGIGSQGGSGSAAEGTTPGQRTRAPRQGAVQGRGDDAPSTGENADGRAIRPVTPHRPGARIWSGGRSGGADRGDTGDRTRPRDTSPSRRQGADDGGGRSDSRSGDPARESAPPRERSSGSDYRERSSRSGGASSSPPPAVRPSTPSGGSRPSAPAGRPSGSSTSGGGERSKGSRGRAG